MWIQRDISQIWSRLVSQPVRILIGPRQSGKSSFLQRHADPGRVVLSLDDLATRNFAREDPKTFLDQHPTALIIDEAQYAPNLFAELKRRVDHFKQQRLTSENVVAPSYWLTGSNRLQLDRDVSESLVGRASFFWFHSLSYAELKKAFPDVTFADYLLKGGWPELWQPNAESPVQYLNNHIRTAFARDIVQTMKINKTNEFLKVAQLLAGRIGGLLNASELARDVGVKTDTVSDWISAIERMMYLIQVPAFHSSLNTRLVKAPKYYFSDLGIASRLQGWTESLPILRSPYLGHLFENAVAAEIIRAKDFYGIDLQLFHWRSRDGEEVDFIVKIANSLIALECKFSANEATNWFPPKQIAKLPGVQYAVVSSSGGLQKHGLPHLALNEIAGFFRSLTNLL